MISYQSAHSYLGLIANWVLQTKTVPTKFIHFQYYCYHFYYYYHYFYIIGWLSDTCNTVILSFRFQFLCERPNYSCNKLIITTEQSINCYWFFWYFEWKMKRNWTKNNSIKRFDCTLCLGVAAQITFLCCNMFLCFKKKWKKNKSKTFLCCKNMACALDNKR